MNSSRSTAYDAVDSKLLAQNTMQVRYLVFYIHYGISVRS